MKADCLDVRSARGPNPSRQIQVINPNLKCENVMAMRGNLPAAVMVTAAIIVALYFGREILLPIALAVLLSFLLAPPVRQLQRLHLPRPAAVVIVVLLAFLVISGLASLMFVQVKQLAVDLPRYQWNLSEKIQVVRSAVTANGTLKEASQVLQSLQKELDQPKNANPVSPPVPDASGSSDTPIPVEVRESPPSALQTMAALSAPLIHPLATAGIIIVFVLFILLQQQDLRNRLIRLGGSHDLQRTTMAMDDAGKRLSRLFLTQMGLNASFGLIIGAGLWAIGVPSAPLWGLLAMVLRFVPYIGAIIAAILPMVVAIAVDPGWSMVLLTAGLFLIVEPLIGQVIEPMVYGQSSGLSPIAVVVSATFWTSLWGPVGLILATPLTMCLVVLGRHVEHLQFFEVLLGDQPALSQSENAYQRLLAGDPVELTEQARIFLKEHTLATYYEQILVSALRRAWTDLQRGRLDQQQTQRIRNTVLDVVEDLESHRGSGKQSSEATPTAPPTSQTERRVLCLPGFGPLDEAVAILLAQLLRRRGIPTEAKKADLLATSEAFELETKDVGLICLCYLEHATKAQLQYTSRRLRRKAPAFPIMVGIFSETMPTGESDPQQIPEGVVFMQGTLSAGVKHVSEMLLRPWPLKPDRAALAKVG
jgi:predicted PurR-regulated permease PerM